MTRRAEPRGERLRDNILTYERLTAQRASVGGGRSSMTPRKPPAPPATPMSAGAGAFGNATTPHSRSLFARGAAPVASPSLDALDRLRGAAKLPGPPGAKEGALRALGALNIGK